MTRASKPTPAPDLEDEQLGIAERLLISLPKRIPLGALLVAAIIFILVSVILGLLAENNATLSQDHHINNNLFSLHTISEFLRELGFASFIAWLIAVTIERVSRENETRRATKVREEIATDVFKAVIGSFVPPDIRDVALRTVLLIPVTRPTARLVFTIRSLPEEAGDLRERYLVLEGNLAYDAKNDTGGTITHDVNLFIPKCPLAEAREEHKLIAVAINDTGLTGSDIRKGYDNVADTEGENRYKWRYNIESRKTLRVSIRWTVIKEFSDYELWTSLTPTSTMDLSIDMQVRNLEWGVDPLYHGTLEPVGGALMFGMNDFPIREPMLPYQGVLIWWRRKSSAAAVDSAGAAIAMVKPTTLGMTEPSSAFGREV